MHRNLLGVLVAGLSLISASCEGGGDSEDNASTTTTTSVNSVTPLATDFENVSAVNSSVPAGEVAERADESSLITPLATDFENVSTVNSSVPADEVAVTGSEITFRAEVLNLVNSHRSTAGVNPALLIVDNSIVQLARDHNLYMAEQAEIARSNGNNGLLISHDNFNDRANSMFALGYNQVGENVAANRNFRESEVSNRFVTGWLNSPGHRANIETPFTHTGIDVYVDPADGTVYATQLFARLP